MCERNHSSCNCAINSSNPSVSQTLDELEFSRGIWTAALDGDYNEVVTFLDKKCLDPNCEDSSGYTALHYASRNGHLSICELLLRRGASPNAQTRSGGITALHRAAYCGHTKIVRLLLDNGANLLLKDSDEKIPLHKAAERSRTEVCEILVTAAPTSVSVRDKRGLKPSDYLQDSSCTTLKTLLLSQDEHG